MKKVNQFTFSKVESDLFTGVTRVAFLDGIVGTLEPVINSYTLEEAKRLGYENDVRSFHREHIVIHNYLYDTLRLAFSPAVREAIKKNELCYFCSSPEECSVKALQQLLNDRIIKDIEEVQVISTGKTLKAIKDELWTILRS